MKKNHFTIALLSFACITLLGNCGDDESQSGEIKAAVHDTCGSSINFDGTLVFASKEIFGGSDYLLVGGYPSDEGRELGIYIPWPPTDGTYNVSISTNVSAYYDPNNTCDCPADGADQYSSINSGGTVTLSDVELDAAQDNVVKMSVSFHNIRVTRIDTAASVIDTLCVNAGEILFGN